MSGSAFDDGREFAVMVNGSGQYSIWPADVAVPAGWRVVLPSTGRQACIDYVTEHWAGPPSSR